MTQTMPAISMWQPWASLVGDRYKKIETRTHNRFISIGCQRVAIHAVGFPGWPEYNRRRAATFECLRRHWTEGEARAYAFYREHPHGCIVATAFIATHRWMTRADELDALCPCDPGRRAIVLANIIRFAEPIPAKGHQGIWYWNVPNHLRGQV